MGNNIKIGLRYLDEVTSVPLHKIEYGFLHKAFTSEMCYHVKNAEKGKTLILNLHYVSSKFDIIIRHNAQVVRKDTVYYNTYLTYSSDDFILQEDNIINTICFSNSNSNDWLSYIFQLEYLETFDKYYFYSSPFFNNYMYKRLLPFGSVISFENIKKYYYSYHLNTHVQGIKGKPVLYGYYCEDSCPSFDKDSFEKAKEDGKLIESTEYFNDFDLLTVSQNVIYILKCESPDKRDCEYYLDINSIKEGPFDTAIFYVRLKNQIDYLVQGGIHFYFSYNENTQLSITNWRGESNVSFHTSKTIKKTVQNKIIYQLTETSSSKFLR